MGPFLSRLCAAAALTLGVGLTLAWMLGSEALLRMLPSSNAVSLNAALAFAVSGAALLMAPGGRLFALRRALAVGVGLGAATVLFENVFDVALGIDWEALHRTVQDGSPRPGRVPPNTCAALVLLAVLLFQRSLADTLARRGLTRACCIGLMALIASGLVGQMLDPTLMFRWYQFNRMAAPAVVALSLLSASVYAQYRTQCALQPLSTAQHRGGILLSGALVVLGTGLAATVTTAVVFANHQLRATDEQLRTALAGQSRLVEVIIDQAGADAAALGARPVLHALIVKAAQHREPADLALLQERLAQLPRQGFASVRLLWADGTLAGTAGGGGGPVALAVPLRSPPGAALLWRHEGYFSQNVTEFAESGGRVVARLVTEQALAALAPGAAPAGASDGEGEVICGRPDGRPACFPSRAQPQPQWLPPASRRARLPVDEALAGRSGVQVAHGPAGESLLVAYAPIGATGLVMQSSVDAARPYQPIGLLLSRSLAVLAIALVVGMWLLHATAGPLLAAMAQSEARAVDHRRRLQSITDQLPALIGFVNAKLEYEFVNATYGRWFGRPESEMLGRPLVEQLGQELFDKSLPNFRRALAGEVVEFTRETNSPLPSYPRHVSVTYIPDRAADGTVLGFNILAFDSTQQQQHERELLQQANHDSLTGLANRRLFHDRLEHALAQARRHGRITALLYLDIDHFKRINDSFGHEEGDRLLVAVGRRVSQAVRASDTVARLGGDEFVVLMEDLRSAPDAEVVARKILAAIRAPIDLAGQTRHVTTSMGLAYANAQDDSPDDLIRRSDAALYDAKQAGRNRYAVRRYAAAPAAVAAGG